MESIRQIFHRYSVYQWVAFFGIVLFTGLTLYSALFRAFDHDEFEALHSAWLVFSGQTIYVDFFQHHHFLGYYVLTPLFALFGESTTTIIAARLVSLVLTLGIFALMYRIATMLYSRQVGLLSVFFLITTITFIDKSIEIRPDVPLVFFELLSVYFLVQYFQSKSISRLLLSALALFIAFLFLQKAVFLGFLIGLVLLYRLYTKQMPWRDFGIYAGLWVALFALFGWYASSVFGLEHYLFLNWKLNTLLLNNFTWYEYLLDSIYQNPVLWGLLGAAVARALWYKRFSLVLFFALGSLVTIFLAKSPFPQYYLMSLPFISVVVAATFQVFITQRIRWSTVLITISLGWSLVSWVLIYEESNTRQLQRVAYVLSITSPNDLVYDGDADFNVFRPDMDYFWYSVKPKQGVLASYQTVRKYLYNPYQNISEKKPKVISDSFISTKNPAIRDFYTESPVFEGLYIRNSQ